MAKYQKPDSLDEVWASEAPSNNIIKPSLSQSVPFKPVDGWTQIKPPFENENWIQNQQSLFAAYLNQIGIGIWDNKTQYYGKYSYVQGSDNKVYRCKQTNTNRNPAISGNGAYWEETSWTRLSTTNQTGIVQLATVAESVEGARDDVAVTPEGVVEAVHDKVDYLIGHSITKMYFFSSF